MKKTLEKAVRTEYAMLRTPLTFLDEHLVSRLGEHSKVRQAVGRGLAGLDAAAGRLLHDQPGSREPAPEVTEISVEEIEERAETFLAEEERHPLAGELAEDEELRRVQAELKAKHQIEEERQAEERGRD